MSAVVADMLVASEAAAGSSHSQTDGRTDDRDDQDSFEQLFEQLRVMKGHCLLLSVLSLYKNIP